MTDSVQDNGMVEPNRDRPALQSCPVCHGRSFKRRFITRGFPIERCEVCGLTVQNPQPSDAELAAIYSSDYFIGSSDTDVLASQFSVVKAATAALQLNEITAYRQHGSTHPGLRLLEIGSGHGHMLLLAHRYGYDVSGLEFSADAATRANQNIGANVVRVGT